MKRSYLELIVLYRWLYKRFISIHPLGNNYWTMFYLIQVEKKLKEFEKSIGQWNRSGSIYKS